VGHRAEVSSYTEGGVQPSHFAAHAGHVAFLEHLASRRQAEASSADHGNRQQPLHMAALAGHAAMARHLERRRAEVCATYSDAGEQPLHAAAFGSLARRALFGSAHSRCSMRYVGWN